MWVKVKILVLLQQLTLSRLLLSDYCLHIIGEFAVVVLVEMCVVATLIGQSDYLVNQPMKLQI